MKNIFKEITFIAIMAASSIVQASQTYNYFYDFDASSNSTFVEINNQLRSSGDYIVSGTFTGTAGSNLITNISNVTESINGGIAVNLDTYKNSNGQSGNAVVSFNGLANDFQFSNSNGTQLSSLSVDGIQANDNSNYLVDNNVTAANWSVTPAVSAVPEAETYAMLLAGLGLMGFISRGRKNS